MALHANWSTATVGRRPRDDRVPTLPIVFSAAIAGGLLAATAYGLLSDRAYRLPVEIAAQARGQDLVTLLTLPVFGWLALRARAGAFRAHLLWLSLLLYYAYTYASYAFSVPFNAMFLVYVGILGGAFYALVDGLLRTDVDRVASALATAPRRAAGVLLVVTGALFALVWLSPILRSLPGGVPDTTFPHEIPSPIWVLDLAFLLPLVVSAGVLLLRGRPSGVLLGVVLLGKILTLSLAGLAMGGFVLAGGSSLRTDEIAVVGLFAVLAALCTGLLVTGARRSTPIGGPWMRRSVLTTRRDSAVPEGGHCGQPSRPEVLGGAAVTVGPPAPQPGSDHPQRSGLPAPALGLAPYADR
jgi:hypothetical protein